MKYYKLFLELIKTVCRLFDKILGLTVYSEKGAVVVDFKVSGLHVKRNTIKIIIIAISYSFLVHHDLKVYLK